MKCYSQMMSQYAQKSFTKDRLQWAKCMVKYACETVKPNVNLLIAILSEVGIFFCLTEMGILTRKNLMDL